MLKLSLCYARRVGLQFTSLHFMVESSREEVAANRLAADYSGNIVLVIDRELLGVTGVVSLTMDTMQCGILEVEQLGVPSVSVFFRASEVMLPGGQEQAGTLSTMLPKGTQVKLNGKLVKGDSKLPYLATTVWVKSKKADTTYRGPQDIKSDLLDSYTSFAQDLDKRSSSEDLEERGERVQTETNHKQDKIRQDHTYTLESNEENNYELVKKKEKYQKRKPGGFNSEKETINYEINFEAKILKTSLNSWKQSCPLHPKFGRPPEFGVFQEIAQNFLCYSRT